VPGENHPEDSGRDPLSVASLTPPPGLAGRPRHAVRRSANVAVEPAGDRGNEPLRGLELWHVADPLEDGERPVRPERGRRSRGRERDEAVPGALDEEGGRRDATDHRVDLTAARQREDDRARGLEERLVAPR